MEDKFRIKLFTKFKINFNDYIEKIKQVISN